MIFYICNSCIIAKSKERTVHWIKLNWYEYLVGLTKIASPDRICCHIRRHLRTVSFELLFSVATEVLPWPCWAVERAKKGLLQKRRATLNGDLRNFTIPRETKTKPFGKNISGSVTQGMSISEETNIEKETCGCKSQTSGFSIHCSLPEVVKTKKHIYMTPGMKRRRQRFTHKQ